MDSEHNIVNLVKFNGKNYAQWKFQIKCALRAKGVYEIAIGTEEKPQAQEGNAESTKEIQKWNKNDAIAMCVITSAMDLNQISLVENCNHSREILEKLDSIYEQKSEVNKLLVHERFYQYKMNPTDTVAQHISKVESLARQIEEAGEKMSNAAIITKVLSSLPSKFWSFRQAWLSVDEAKQTLQNLTARLLDEEANLNINSETENALTAASARKSNVPHQDSKRTKAKFTCYNCNKKDTLQETVVHLKEMLVRKIERMSRIIQIVQPKVALLMLSLTKK